MDPASIETDIGVDDTTIKIGLNADLSGIFAPLVTQIVDGQEAYWEIVNDNGGIAGRQVELVVLDNGYDVPKHLENYEVMSGDGAEGVVIFSQSTGSPHTTATADLLVEDDLIAIPLSWYSGWPDPAIGQNVFEAYTSYCVESMNGVSFMAENFDAQTIAIIGFPGEYGQDGAAGAKIAAEALGLEVVYDGEAAVVPGADQTPVITELVNAQPDIVWATVNPTTFAEIMGSAVAQGLQAQWSGNSPTYNFQLLGTELAPVLDQYYTHSTYTQLWNSADVPGMTEVVEGMREKRPDAPVSDVYIVAWTEGYITQQILEQAARNGDMTRAGVVAAAERDHGRSQGPGAGPDVGRRAQRLHRARVVHVRRRPRQLHPGRHGVRRGRRHRLRAARGSVRQRRRRRLRLRGGLLHARGLTDPWGGAGRGPTPRHPHRPPWSSPLLTLANVEVVYNEVILVLRGLSIEVPDGRIVALLGANGAGKTTTLRAVTGLLDVHKGVITKGTVTYDGTVLNERPPAEIVAGGITQVMEGRRVFAELTVDENLVCGGITVKDKSLTAAAYERVMDLFPRLQERRKQVAGYLSGGEQQMLAIGRALMSSPKLLVLDEPSLGLAPMLVEQIRDIIVDINAQGTSVLLIEQNAMMALSIAHYGYIMETGKVVMDGEPRKLLADDDVREFYLGLRGDEGARHSFRNVKHYKRRKRWLS